MELLLLSSDLQDYNFATAATISTLGILASRTVLTPTYANLNLYNTIVGLTGAGKESFLTAPWMLLNHLGLSHLQGLTGFTSGALIEKHISEYPATIHQIDELSDLIAKTSTGRTNSFEKDILKILKSLWSAKHNAIYAIVGNLQTEKTNIVAPSNNIISCTTPEPFFNTLTETMFNDGFINRFLFYPQQQEKKPQYQVKDQDKIKTKLENLLPKLRTIYNFSNINDRKLNLLYPKPQAIEWTKEAEKDWQDINQHIYEISRYDDDVANIVQRTAEMVLKIATIVAVSRDVLETNNTPKIQANDVKYAYAICQQSVNFLYQSKKRRVFSNKNEYNFKVIQDYIKFQGSNGIEYSKLVNITTFVKDKERREIISELIKNGFVEHDIEKNIYKWLIYK